jgi:hypothetical protein
MINMNSLMKNVKFGKKNVLKVKKNVKDLKRVL